MKEGFIKVNRDGLYKRNKQRLKSPIENFVTKARGSMAS